MKKLLVVVCVLLPLFAAMQTSSAAVVTQTISGTYVGAAPIQIHPLVNKTAFVVGQQYELYTVTYDNEDKCWTEYWDDSGLPSNSGCMTSIYYDWYTDADVVLGADLNAALALYTMCPYVRETHWDHSQSMYGYGWVGHSSMHDLWEIYGWWHPDNTANSYVRFWIKGFIDGYCPLLPTEPGREFVNLQFGDITVTEGTGGGAVEIWTCGGATFGEGYEVDVTVDPPFEGIWYQVEGDDDGACQDFKDAEPDFACNQKGEGNLVTSSIDDDVDPVSPLDYHQSNTGATMIVGDSEVSAVPSYAMVHADVFIPGACSTAFSCDHDANAETPEIDCYDSGFGGGSYAGGYFGTAYESCAAAFGNTSEGFWAEMNEGGGMISPNRNPKKTANNNWAMYVQLTDPDCEGAVTVPTSGIDYVETETAPACEQASRTFNGIVDGGDYYVDGGTVAGTVEFTPTSNCTATYYCDSLDGVTCETAPPAE